MTSMDIIAQALLQMSEKISSISMSVSILSECRGYMAQMLIEMKEMNEQLKKLNNEEVK